jgi:chromate transporter
VAAEDGLTRPGLPSLFVSFLRLGAVSFGGPAMVAYIKRLAVTRKGWLREDDFQKGVALCQAVPGATAMQCAAYVGLRVRRLPGAIATYVGFGLPAFVLMLALSIAYQRVGHVPAVTSVLTGLRALVVALVANAAWTFARSSVKGIRDGTIGLAAAVLFFLGVSPFLIVLVAALAGALSLRTPTRAEQTPLPPQKAGWRSLRSPALVLGIGAVLVGSLYVLDKQLAALSLVMMKIDAFAFGGGFASVPLIFREVVDVRRWMSASAFMDGIALGQVTPGPIVITATFVGQQVAGVSGAVVATVSVFLPSLFALVLVEPWFRRLSGSPVFQAATRGLVLSFVGLLASVTIQFARLTPWHGSSVIIAALALAALLFQIDVLWVVLGGAVASALLMS